MTREELVNQIVAKKSYLCVGLDSELDKLPKHLLQSEDPQFEFNKRIIDATLDYCVAYKINTAFYECLGAKGWQTLEKTIKYIPSTHFTIADAKRGDIGNTSTQYARAFFEHLNFDAVTVAPYMGEDSVKPFLQYPGKWAIVLGLTSNPGSADFEMLQTPNGLVYQQVLKKTASWGNPSNLMYVIGATRSEMVSDIRRSFPEHFFLVPGVGAQGGSLEEISQKGMNASCGLLVNASRAIIFASTGNRFAEDAATAARNYQVSMKSFLERLPA